MSKMQNLLLEPEVFNMPIFGIHLRCFRWYGYLVSEDQRRPWLHLLRGTFFTASIWLSCALMLARVFRGYENLNDGATSCATAVQYLAVSIATLNALVQRQRVLAMLRLADADLKRLRLEANDQELALLKATQRYAHTITYLLWVPSVMAALMACSDCIYRTIFLPESVFNMPAVKRGEAQPILLFKLFPFGEMCDHFLVGYLGPWYALSLGITTIPLWHTFIACLMQYVTLKLEILSKRVERMDVTRLKAYLDVDRLKPEELTRLQLQLLTTFVREELKIYRFINEILNLIRVPVMADFIIFSILMCFLFFALTVGIPSKMDYFFMTIYLFVMVSILWIYHWHATLIVESHKNLSFAFYACEWYNYSLPVQKKLFFIMVHAQRSFRMRALLVDLNLTTFIDIVRGAYSYFNLLRSSHLN